MANRPYTGYDATASGKRAGFETLIDLLEAHFGLWNNGTWGVRSKRGKTSMSVHATGRAGDLSWRGAPYRGSGNYQDACRMIDWLIDNAYELGIEAVFDYYPQPYGRGWICDRKDNGNNGWVVYEKRAFSGAPGGDWVHIEVSDEWADDPQHYIDYFAEKLGEADVKPAPAKKTAKAPTGKKPWLQVGSKGPEVKKVQELVGATVDGDYGPKTEAAVKKWQAEHDLHVDGIWGPGSQAHSEDCDHGVSGGTAVEDDAYPGTPVKRGSRGEAAKKVQGVIGAKQDGWIGPASERRIKAWQRRNGLLADGVVGPKTWAKMFN
jgi:peptidoglycan hydrolase-like protein with peptidoglycan-binding domain